MPLDRLVGPAVNVVVYLALIAFVPYRQMRAQPLRARPLVLLPVVLSLFGLHQLGRQSLVADWGGVAVLAFGVVIGLATGHWRGSRSGFGPMPAG